MVNEDHLKDNCSKYARARFAGGIISIDAVNIVCKKVSWNQQQSHLGYKKSLTARSYNVSMNHSWKLFILFEDFCPARMTKL